MFLVYSNSALTKENLQENARKLVSKTEGSDGYVIHLIGEIFPEEKKKLA